MTRSTQIPLLVMAGALLLIPGGPLPVRAQDQDFDQEDLQRAVARISLINGDVSVRRGDSGDWVAGAVNAPLLTQDYVSTGPNSRAEIQFDSANVLRIGANAEVRLVQLEYGRYQMEMARGTATFVVLKASNANVELDTPSVSLRPSKIGVYRVLVSEAGETEVTVRSGDLEVFTPRGSQWVSAGQSMQVRGSNDDPEFQIVQAAPLDEWDRWNETRDRTYARSLSTRYVPEGVYGTEDLDTYGTWANVDGYGYCWRPTVSVSTWAPYRSGRWVWEDWYGWSWVSYDPWGWAPYHYGRWFYNTGSWWWYPGAFGSRHYWSPALVAWFGFGGGGGVGFGYGNVGWIPLGPREPFHRWWGRGYYGRGGFDRSIHITNVNITNIYRNSRVRNGISGINTNDFRGGRFGNVRGFSGDQVRQVGLVRGQMPIAPDTHNLRFSDRNVAHVPTTRDNMKFFSRQQPSGPQRLSFAQQRQAFTGERGSAAGGSRANNQAGRNSVAGGVRAQNDRPQAATGGQQSGWGRFGQPSSAPDAQRASPSRATGRQSGAGSVNNDRPAASQSRGAWQRFNESPASGAAPRNTQPGAGATRGTVQQQQQQQSPAGRGGWQRFGEPGGSQRQPAQQSNPSRSSEGSSRGAASQFNSTPRSAQPQQQQQLRMAPPVVRERSNNNQTQRSYTAPQRTYSPPSSSAPRQQQSQPRSYSAPSYSAPRQQQSQPRSYSAPRQQQSQRSYSAPRQQSQRSYSAPRQQSQPRSYSAPSAPRGGASSSPRSMGGGASRNSGGGASRQGGSQRGRR